MRAPSRSRVLLRGGGPCSRSRSNSAKGYVATAPGLRRRVEAALMPDDVVDVRPLSSVRRCGPVVAGSRA